MTRSINRFTYRAFDGLPYKFRSGTKVFLSGIVEIECETIPDVIEIEVRDAAEPEISYTTRLERGHPMHRHVAMHVTRG